MCVCPFLMTSCPVPLSPLFPSLLPTPPPFPSHPWKQQLSSSGIKHTACGSTGALLQEMARQAAAPLLPGVLLLLFSILPASQQGGKERKRLFPLLPSQRFSLAPQGPSTGTGAWLLPPNSPRAAPRLLRLRTRSPLRCLGDTPGWEGSTPGCHLPGGLCPSPSWQVACAMPGWGGMSLKGVTQGSPGKALLRKALVKGGLQGTASWGEALGHLRLGDTGGLGTHKAWGHAGREQGRAVGGGCQAPTGIARDWATWHPSPPGAMVGELAG